MPVQVIMPQFGESVVEGTITRWIKSVGETVNELEPLLEVNTDKVDTEVPAPASGILLAILVPEGTTIQAGSVLATIGLSEETPGPAQPEGKPQAQAGAPVSPEPAATWDQPAGTEPQLPLSPSRQQDRELGFISPVVARMAQEYHLDLSQVPGTGLSGRITRRDVERYLEGQAQKPLPAAQPLSQASTFPTPGEILPLTPVRRLIAEHMVLSKRTSPHATTVMEADLSRVGAHRQASKEPFAQAGVNLTFTPYFIVAVVQALKAFPVVNSSWSEEGIRIHSQIHIGLATSLEDGGLIVPVIRSADSLSLLGISRAVNDLSGRARLRKLKPEEVRDGTFTLTNHGTSGSLFATPIINQPQCGILGVGLIQKRVVVISDEFGNDTIAIRPMVYLSFTFDHRILDGAIADHFLRKVVESLEHFG
jgi:2-oxoglutarate dehydrogenase E2 component (dihydrolipoamide succinyltransferase)